MLIPPSVAVYAISFLCTLNTRKIIRGKGTDHEGPPTGGASAPASANPFSNVSGNQFYVPRINTNTNASGYRGEYSNNYNMYSGSKVRYSFFAFGCGGVPVLSGYCAGSRNRHPSGGLGEHGRRAGVSDESVLGVCGESVRPAVYAVAPPQHHKNKTKSPVGTGFRYWDRVREVEWNGLECNNTPSFVVSSNSFLFSVFNGNGTERPAISILDALRY
jgi:hypothetical protein